MKYVMSAIVLFVCAVALHAQTPSLDDVLSKHYNAIGGVEKFRAVQSCLMRGLTVSSDGSWKKKYTLNMKQNRVKVEMDIQPGMKMVQAYDGTSGWSIMPWSGSLDPQPMNASNSKSMSVRTDFFRNDLVMYKVNDVKLELVGSEELDGSDCYKIIAHRSDGVTREYYLDVDSYLIVKQVTKYRINDEDEESESYYSNYRQQDGMMLPHAVEGKGGGGFYIDNYSINASIDDSIFVMPKKG